MNVIEQARQAYAPQTSPVADGRTAEHRLFTQVTARLRQASLRRDADFAGFAAALHENRLLWNHMAAMVAEEENGLAPDLRARLFYLAEFTTYHSRKALQDGASADPLIEINTAVMRGLSGVTGA